MNETREEVEMKFVRVMALSGMSRGQLVMLIGEMNGVSRQSVYKWIHDLTFPNKARIMFALEEIERDFSEQAVTAETTV